MSLLRETTSRVHLQGFIAFGSKPFAVLLHHNSTFFMAVGINITSLMQKDI
jgi:hypothetical protein